LAFSIRGDRMWQGQPFTAIKCDMPKGSVNVEVFKARLWLARS